MTGQVRLVVGPDVVGGKHTGLSHSVGLIEGDLCRNVRILRVAGTPTTVRRRPMALSRVRIRTGRGLGVGDWCSHTWPRCIINRRPQQEIALAAHVGEGAGYEGFKGEVGLVGEQVVEPVLRLEQRQQRAVGALGDFDTVHARQTG